MRSNPSSSVHCHAFDSFVARLRLSGRTDLAARMSQLIGASERQARHERCMAAVMASDLEAAATQLYKEGTQEAGQLAREARFTRAEILEKRCCEGCSLFRTRS